MHDLLWKKHCWRKAPKASKTTPSDKCRIAILIRLHRVSGWQQPVSPTSKERSSCFRRRERHTPRSRKNSKLRWTNQRKPLKGVKRQFTRSCRGRLSRALKRPIPQCPTHLVDAAVLLRLNPTIPVVA